MWPGKGENQMASQFPPEPLGVIDLGNAPEVFVDGIASFTEKHGVYRFAFYTEQPVTQCGDDLGEPADVARSITVKVACSGPALAVMLRQVAAIVSVREVTPITSLGVMPLS